MTENRRMALLFLVAVLVYGNTLSNGFTYDDFIYIRNPSVQADSLTGLLEPTKFNNVFRPITFATFALDWRLNGPHPFGYHVVNLLLHAAVTILLYLLVRRLLESASYASTVAFVTALLFAVHPIHTEVVASITGRSELLAAGFLLLAWLLHLEDRLIPAILCLLLAMMSKESAVVFPALAVVGDLARGKLKPAVRYLCIASTVAAYLALFWRVEGRRFGEKGVAFVDNPLAYLPASVRIPNALRVGWKYVGLQLFPYKLSSDYSYNAVLLYSDWRHALPVAVASLLVLGLLFWALWSGRKHWFLAGATYLAAFAATANLLLPTGTIMGERLAYLPSAGFCLLLALLWAVVEKRTRMLAWVVLIALVAALGIRAAVRNRDWRDNLSLFSADVRTVPGSARAHVNLGIEYLHRNQMDQALAELKAGLEIYPTFSSGLENYGLLQSRLGHDQEALESFRRALSVVPEDYFERDFMEVNLAAQLIKLGQYEEALMILNQIISKSPNCSRAWSNRAVLRYRRGDFASARADAETALRLDSTNGQAESLLMALNAPAGALPETWPAGPSSTVP